MHPNLFWNKHDKKQQLLLQKTMDRILILLHHPAVVPVPAAAVLRFQVLLHHHPVFPVPAAAPPAVILPIPTTDVAAGDNGIKPHQEDEEVPLPLILQVNDEQNANKVTAAVVALAVSVQRLRKQRKIMAGKETENQKTKNHWTQKQVLPPKARTTIPKA